MSLKSKVYSIYGFQVFEHKDDRSTVRVVITDPHRNGRMLWRISYHLDNWFRQCNEYLVIGVGQGCYPIFANYQMFYKANLPTTSRDYIVVSNLSLENVWYTVKRFTELMCEEYEKKKIEIEKKTKALILWQPPLLNSNLLYPDLKQKKYVFLEDVSEYPEEKDLFPKEKVLNMEMFRKIIQPTLKPVSQKKIYITSDGSVVK